MAFNFGNPYNFGWSSFGPNNFNGQQSAGPPRPPPPGYTPEMLYSGGRYPGVFPYGMPYPNQNVDQNSHYPGANWNFTYPDPLNRFPHVQPNNPTVPVTVAPAVPAVPPTIPPSTSGSVPAILAPSNNVNSVHLPTTSNTSVNLSIQSDSQSLLTTSSNGNDIKSGIIDSDIVNKVSNILSYPNALHNIRLYSSDSEALNNSTKDEPIASETESAADKTSSIEQIVAATLKVASQKIGTPAHMTPAKSDNLASVTYVTFNYFM